MIVFYFSYDNSYTVNYGSSIFPHQGRGVREHLSRIFDLWGQKRESGREDEQPHVLNVKKDYKDG
jgi:hypothetical protein